MRRCFLLLCVAATLAACSVSGADKPNIVLIISDDQGWTDYGFMGHPQIQTPQLDKLASQSLVFRRGYSSVESVLPVAGEHHHRPLRLADEGLLQRPAAAESRAESGQGRERQGRRQEG